MNKYVIPNIRNKIEFERVKAPKIDHRKWPCINLILSHLRWSIYRQLSRCSNSSLFLIFGIMLAFLFILYGCSRGTPSTSTRYYPSEKLKIANEIREKVAKELMEKTGLRPCGSGGQMMDQVEMLALAFTYNKPIELEEGRKLLVTAVETFVSEINSDERIRPYLGHFPFEPKNVEITIVIRNPDFSCVEPETVCVFRNSG